MIIVRKLMKWNRWTSQWIYQTGPNTDYFIDFFQFGPQLRQNYDDMIRKFAKLTKYREQTSESQVSRLLHSDSVGIILTWSWLSTPTPERLFNECNTRLPSLYSKCTLRLTFLIFFKTPIDFSTFYCFGKRPMSRYL